MDTRTLHKEFAQFNEDAVDFFPFSQSLRQIQQQGKYRTFQQGKTLGMRNLAGYGYP